MKATIETYRTVISYEDFDKVLYEGECSLSAEEEYEDASDEDNRTCMAILYSRVDTFEFIGELEEDESIEDYPIEDWFEDSYYWSLIQEGDLVEEKARDIERSEVSSENLESQVQDWLSSEFGRKYGFYSSIDYASKSVMIRVKDHSQNPQNKQKSTCDHNLSIVIANKNATVQRFHSTNELHFNGSNTLEEVQESVLSWLEDL